MTSKVDWDALKYDYMFNSVTFVELAKKYKVSETAIRKQSSRNNWPLEKQQASEKVQNSAFDLMQEQRSVQLAQWNDEDIRLARALRAKAAQMMMDSGKADAATLRSIASVADTAQKIARLAFGVSTENATVTNKELPISIHEFC
jgi:hypothetical protein